MSHVCFVFTFCITDRMLTNHKQWMTPFGVAYVGCQTKWWTAFNIVDGLCKIFYLYERMPLRKRKVDDQEVD